MHAPVTRGRVGSIRSSMTLESSPTGRSPVAGHAHNWRPRVRGDYDASANYPRALLCASGSEWRRVCGHGMWGSRSGRVSPGPENAITDVAGVQVGYCTLVSGSGELVVGAGPVRTGVTVVLPHGGRPSTEPVFAGYHRLNGFGELTGLEWLHESGMLTSPIALTNTNSVGIVRDTIIAREVALPGRLPIMLPVVGETWDGILNDIGGQHVRPEHVHAAFADARTGPIAEGNVGGGTGSAVLRVQGRHGDGLPVGRPGRAHLHGRGAGAGQPRRPAPLRGQRGPGRADPGVARGPGPADVGDHPRPPGHRFGPCGGGHRRPAAAPPAEPDGPARRARDREVRRAGGQLLRGPDDRLLHGRPRPSATRAPVPSPPSRSRSTPSPCRMWMPCSRR